MLARRAAIGVRSSWLASAISWRCASTERSRAASVALKLAASRASSSRPRTSSRCEASRLVGELLGAAREAHDRSQGRARDEPPEQGRERDSADRHDHEDQQDRGSRSLSTSVSGRAIISAPFRTDPDRQHPQPRAVHDAVAEGSSAAARRDLPVASVRGDRAGAAPARRARGPGRGGEELDVAARLLRTARG